MLDYARERAREALRTVRTAVMATSGPAGVQVGEFPCQSIDLELFLLVPKTSDHLFNLEHSPGVTLLTDGWELKGSARVVLPDANPSNLRLWQEREAKWCVLVKVDPGRLEIRKKRGWGNLETIDLQTE